MEGRCRDLVGEVSPVFSSMRESTMMMKETDVMRKQKTMLPTVSIRALPEGKRRGSTCWMAWWQIIRVMLDRGSKMASAMVVKREREVPAEMAA